MNQPKVCVINQLGRALMPTTPRKARILIKEGRAKIVD
ncbi:RRXRR domain-containing protein, partial [Phormidium pseudopriestleyi FRX01]|nr:RRXRR domain-containing protein [Phormidium pseudopriestleyi FRX01]